MGVYLRRGSGVLALPPGAETDVESRGFRLEIFRITEGAIDSTTHVVEPHGEIDLATAGVLKASLDAALDAKVRHVIVDLEGVDFIDSSGLAVLIFAARRLQARGGNLIVACPKPTVRRAFAITSLDEVLQVQESRRDAILLAQDFAQTAG